MQKTLLVSFFLFSLTFSSPAFAKAEHCVWTLNPFKWISCLLTPLEPEWEGESEGYGTIYKEEKRKK